MDLTAELRLWWPRCPQHAEAAWQRLPGRACREDRTDLYFLDLCNAEVGIKQRGEDASQGLEIKQLAGCLGSYRQRPMELWVKSQSAARALDLPALGICKSRLLKAIPSKTGKAPAQVELSEVRCDGDGQHWWTLGFEAPATLADPKSELLRTLELFESPAEVFDSGEPGGYPKWLAQIRPRAADADRS